MAVAMLHVVQAPAQVFVPQPVRVTPLEGEFRLGAFTRIAADSVSMPAAEYLMAHLSRVAGTTLSLKYTSSPSSSYAFGSQISLSVDSLMDMPSEGYRLKMSPHSIAITGKDYGGLFNGVQTLLQMFPYEIYASMSGAPTTFVEKMSMDALPCMEVEDYPRFGYRGMMLDVARTFVPVDEVRRFIDLLAYHKINKLHWHLSDDEGWRVEILSHPELTCVGAFRGGNSPIWSIYGRWGERYGGYYTQQQVREIVAYAAVRNIEVIPEIDLPGHSRTAAKVFGHILCDGTPATSGSGGYDMRNVWCVAKESNYALLEDILRELSELFPSQLIHLGGDEVLTGQWSACAACRELMRKEGFTRVGELESYFLSRLNEIVMRNGKHAAVWTEGATDGLLSRDVTVYGWHSVEECKQSLRAGYRTVVMPSSYFYFDMRQGENEDGLRWAGVFDASRPYSFDFATEGFTAADMERVEGIEGAFWSEVLLNHNPYSAMIDFLDYQTFPRVCALSEQAWNADRRPSWQLFADKLDNGHFARMSQMGIAYRLFPPQVKYEDGKIYASTTKQGAVLRYRSLAEPDAGLREMKFPIATSRPDLYLVSQQFQSGTSPEVAAASPRYLRPRMSFSSSLTPSTKAPFKNIENYRFDTYGRTTSTYRRGDHFTFAFDEAVEALSVELITGFPMLARDQVEDGHVEILYQGDSDYSRAARLQAGRALIYPERRFRALRIVTDADGNGRNTVIVCPPRIIAPTKPIAEQPVSADRKITVIDN